MSLPFEIHARDPGSRARAGKLSTAHGPVLTPVFIFCLFDWALTIPLPKGISEPLFYPIYDLIY